MYPLASLFLAAMKAVEGLNLSLDIKLHITQGAMPSGDSTLDRSNTKGSETEKDTAIGSQDAESLVPTLLSHPRVSISKGRPAVIQLLDEEISLSAGPVSVVGMYSKSILYCNTARNLTTPI